MTITSNASKSIDLTRKLLIKVVGGGCSGYMYEVEEISDTTNLIKISNEFELYTNSSSQEMIKDTTLDYISNPIGGGSFTFSYNKATRCCGCKKSFC